MAFVTKRSAFEKGADTAQLRVLWRCHGCGMPRIDTSCPLCGRTQEFTFVRFAKLDGNGLAGLVSELQKTLQLAEVELRNALAKAPAAAARPTLVSRPVDRSSSATAGAGPQASNSCAAKPSHCNGEIRVLAFGLVADLTAKSHELARLKSAAQTSVERRASNSRVIGTRSSGSTWRAASRWWW